MGLSESADRTKPRWRSAGGCHANSYWMRIVSCKASGFVYGNCRLVLLAGAGLMIRSLRSVMQVTPGFRSDHLLTMLIDLRSDRYTKPEQGGAFVNGLLERVTKLPGTRSAAVE